MPTVWWLPALRHLLGLGWNAGPHPWNTSLDPGPEPSQSPGANTIHSRVWSQGRSKRGVRNQVCPWEADAQPCALPRLQPWPCPHPCPHLVGAETLQGVVRELVSHVDEAVVGVDVVQTVRLGLARGLAHVLAIPEETVEVELVGIFAVRGEAGVAAGKNHSPRSLAFLEPPPAPMEPRHLLPPHQPCGVLHRNGPLLFNGTAARGNYRSQHALLPFFFFGWGNLDGA